MKKLLIIPLFLVLVVAVAANARPQGKMGGSWNWWENEELVKEVGLSDEQLA